jgi:hypothetical protein
MIIHEAEVGGTGDIHYFPTPKIAKLFFALLLYNYCTVKHLDK